MRDDIVTEYNIENITLWLLSLRGVSGAELEEMYTLCSTERRAKADRIKQESKRRQSVGAGYLLSLLKGRYLLEEEPVILEGGKPAFRENRAVQFNISHSHDTVLLAFGDRPLGADIEFVGKANLKIAKRFFAEEEYDFLSGQKEADRGDAFCRIWTGKEAVGKAEGSGLSLIFDRFSVLGKTVEINEKKYELYQRKMEIDGRGIWLSAAQLMTDSGFA